MLIITEFYIFIGIKLISDFGEKKDYVVHYMNLQYYMSQGVKLVNVKRVIKFKQKPIAREMIQTTTKKRGEATSDIMTSFLKFFNNILYG